MKSTFKQIEEDDEIDTTGIGSNSEVDPNVPVDNYYIVYLIFLLFGVGALLPWNALLTAFDFFEAFLDGYDPVFVFPLALNGPNFIFILVMVAVGDKISPVKRVCVSFLINFAICLILPILTVVFDITAAFYTDIAILVIFGSATAVVQGGVFGFAGVFPLKYTGAVMFGQGVAGLTVNGLRAICLLIWPPDKDLGREDKNSLYGTLVYFGLSGIVLLIGCAAMLYLRTNPFAMYYINKGSGKPMPNITEDSAPLISNQPGSETAGRFSLNATQKVGSSQRMGYAAEEEELFLK